MYLRVYFNQDWHFPSVVDVELNPSHEAMVQVETDYIIRHGIQYNELRFAPGSISVVEFERGDKDLGQFKSRDGVSERVPVGLRTGDAWAWRFIR